MARYIATAAGSIQADSVVGFNPGAGTVAVRMRPRWSSLDSTDHVLWACEQASSGGAASFLFERYLDNNFYVGMLASGDNRIAFADVAGYVQPQVWKSYVYSWDNGAGFQRCYIGGRLVGSRGASTVPSVDRVCIGRPRAGAGSGAEGDLEDWAFWTCALTLDELQRYERGDSPNSIRPAFRLAYIPILGGIAPEIDLWRGLRLDVQGTLPVKGSKRFRVFDLDANLVGGGGTVTGDGASAGVGTAAAVGAATAAGDGLSAGTGVALGVGAFTMAPTTGVANAVGAGTAAAVGAATAAGVGNAAGLGTALATGAAVGIISAVGNAAGTSTALGVSPQLLGGGEAGRGAKGGRARRKRIEWLPADYDIETGEPLPQPEVPVSIPAPSVQLSKGERKVARLLAQYRGRDDDVAERARAQLEALRAAEDGALARFIARQQALDVQRRAAAAIAAEDDDAVVAFMRWMMSNP